MVSAANILCTGHKHVDAIEADLCVFVRISLNCEQQFTIRPTMYEYMWKFTNKSVLTNKLAIVTFKLFYVSRA